MKPSFKNPLMIIPTLLALTFSILGSTPVHAAGIRYAKPNATGSDDCSSWANACTLQTALTGATAGDEIWVAAGTYKPTTGTDRTATFQLKDGVAIYGGFDGTETARDQRNPAINITTLSGDIGAAGNSDNSYHVVTGATGATLDGFTITAGNANGTVPNEHGGGMFNSSSSPTLTNVTISGNLADYGGGMYNSSSSSPTLMNVTFSGNSAKYDGAGMYNSSSSSPTLTNVTFSTNSAIYNGGGMHNTTSCDPTLMNVTFSGNSARYGGGMSNFSSSPILTNVTFTGNSAIEGGGMRNDFSSNPVIRNTIFWGNAAPNEAQIYNKSGSTSSVSDSVIQVGCPAGSTCTNIITNNPMLGTLGNDGSFTQTIPLLPGSSAIDATSVNCPATDQRGQPRSNPTCDIGAYEVQTIIPVIHGILMAIPGGATSGLCQSWADACELSYVLPNATFGKEIWVAAGTYKPTTGTDRASTFQLKNGVAVYGGFAGTEAARTERDPAANITILSGDLNGDDVGFTDNLENVYHVVTGANGATLDGLTISGGNANGSGNPVFTDRGGGMYNGYGSDPTLTDITFRGNSAIYGGGMSNYPNSNPTLTNVTFSGNSATYGGGMYNLFNSNPTLTNVTFSGNSAAYGGGMCNDHSNPMLTDVTFNGNSATNSGGGMYNVSSSKPTLANVIFSGNSSNWDGGGMYNSYSIPTLTDVTFSDNSARNGGGMNNSGSSPTLTDVIFSSNTATDDGGGMNNSSGSPTLKDVTFSNNTATNAGGGMNSSNGSPTLTGVTFNGNSADICGGMENSTGGSPKLTDVIFSGNSASNQGGGMCNDNNSPVLMNVTFNNNSGTVYGGGIFNYMSSLTLTNIAFNGNSANYGGGMYSFNNSNQLLTNVTFTGNSAFYGGGIYNDYSSLILTDATFSGNSATYGGGGMENFDCSPVLTNVAFNANSAKYYGGGMNNSTRSNPTLTNVTFSGNLATYGYGGGMFNKSNSNPTLATVTFSSNSADYGGGMVNDASSNPTLTNAIFSSNSAKYYGGGMYNSFSSPSLTNVTFSGNSASNGRGGGIYNLSSNPTLTSLTFSSNSANYGGGMYNDSSNPVIRNTIFWGNTATTNGAQIYNAFSTPVVSDDVVQGGYAGGTNIITADPLLGTLGDYGGLTETIPLLPGSSAIDAGNATYCTTGTDQRGISYVGTCDIGAFESRGFTLTKTGGDNQTILINTAFMNPLTLDVTSAYSEPVNGGKVTLTAPVSGASTNPTEYLATISSGAISQNVTANAAAGSYEVTASANGANAVTFALLNIKYPPIVTTEAASLVTSVGATFNGTVNANNDSSAVTFEYGLTDSYGTTVAADQSPVTGLTDTAVSATLTDLLSNTTYHYRTIASNSAGTTNGSDQTFTTNKAAPVATTDAASAITSNGATLNGTVNANNDSSIVTFEYGTDTSYGTTVTAVESPVTGTTNTAVSKAIIGLTPNTTYHYRVIAVNSVGTTNGSDQTFTTSAIAPTATTDAASLVTSTGATLNGTVNANNDNSTVTFEYGLNDSYGTSVGATPSPVIGTTDTAVSKAITDLTPNTTYHYRVVAVNSAGTINGSDQAFTTSSNPNSSPTDITLSTTSVAENKPVGTAIGNLTATDPDAGDTHTFTLQSGVVGCASANNVSFQISGNQLKTKTIFNYELKNRYSICVRASDGKGGIFNKSFTIMVTNVIDEIAKNGGFEIYSGTTKIPANWVQSKFSALDGKNTIKKTGKYSVKITGMAAKIKTLTQTLNISGAKGNAFKFSYWAKGTSIPAAGVCQAQVSFYSGATLKGTKLLKCPTGATYNWKKANLSFIAPAAYTKVVIKFTYSKASGSVWFDAVSLMK